MKRTILTALAFAGAAAFGVTVESDNAVGVIGVAVKGGVENLVAVPFEGYDSNDVTVDDVVKTAGLAEGTILMAVGRDGSRINTWRLSGGKWVAAKQVTVGADGSSDESSGAPSATSGLSRGDAFWLQPPTAGTAYVLGQKPSEGGKAVAAQAGWNVLGNPHVRTSSLSSAIKSPAQGDTIVVADENGYEKRYTYVTGKGWCHRVNGKLTAADVSLKPGEGCWLNVKTAQNIEW